MGWSYTYRPKGMSNEEFFSKEFPYTKFLGFASHGLNEVYAAVESKNGRGVFALAIMTRWVKDDYNFGYKDIDEDMLPYIQNCPESILNLLSPTENTYALKWREGCRENNRVSARLKPGDVVNFTNPITFTDGVQASSLRVSRVTRHKLYFYPHYVLSRDYVTCHAAL